MAEGLSWGQTAMTKISDRIEDLKNQGKALAQAKLPEIEHKVFSGNDRYQSGIPLRNMIRALEMFSWDNSVDDWERYFTAKLIVKTRNKKARMYKAASK